MSQRQPEGAKIVEESIIHVEISKNHKTHAQDPWMHSMWYFFGSILCAKSPDYVFKTSF